MESSFLNRKQYCVTPILVLLQSGMAKYFVAFISKSVRQFSGYKNSIFCPASVSNVMQANPTIHGPLAGGLTLINVLRRSLGVKNKEIDSILFVFVFHVWFAIIYSFGLKKKKKPRFIVMWISVSIVFSNSLGSISWLSIHSNVGIEQKKP